VEPGGRFEQRQIANPVFTPTKAGIYPFTVTGTNATGCTADRLGDYHGNRRPGHQECPEGTGVPQGAVQEVSAEKCLRT
jgi:hypothetical protein